MKSTDEGRPIDRELAFYAEAMRLNAKLAVRPFVIVGRLINYAVGLLAAVASVWFAYMLIEHWATPVDFLETRMLTPTTVPGGRIKVLFDINRRKVCQVDPNWAVFGGDGEKYTVLAQHMDAGGPLDHDPFIRSFELPNDIKPGHGRFRAIWSWVCPLNFVDLEFARTSESADLPFEIVEKPPLLR